MRSLLDKILTALALDSDADPSRTPTWVEVTVFLVVALVSLKTTHGLLGTFDVGLDDETIYLDGARYLGVHFLPLAESSPLYPMWYRFLSLVEPDRLRLYFTNWYVLTAALPIALYALGRRSGAPLAAASASAIAWSVSAAGTTWPFVTKFAALLLALGALGATCARDARVAAAIVSVTLSLCSYARAELTIFAIAFAAFVGVWGLGSFVSSRSGPRSGRWLGLVAAALAIVAAVLLRLRFGDTNTGNRAYFAFAQHYALNVVEERKLSVDPWTNWLAFAKEAFPAATTVAEAAKENRGAFAWHVTRNVTTLPKALSELVRPLAYVPTPLRDLVSFGFGLALVSGGAGFVFFRARRPGRVRRWFPLVAIVGASTALASLVIYPRQHYLLPLCAIGTAALVAGGARVSAAIASSPSLGRLLPLARVSLIVALASFLAAVPGFRPSAAPSLIAPALAAPGPEVQENVLTIRALRRLHLVGRVVILESDHSRAVYTDYEDYVRVAQGEKNAPFWDFVRARGVNVIVMNDRLRNDTRFESDPEFQRFAAGAPPLEDFELFPVPKTRAVIAVRRTLLPAR